MGEGIQQRDGMEQPVYYWDPVVSPSGMTFYSSNRIPEWQNNLFVAALSGMHIVRVVIENNRVVGEERLLACEGQRFRDITQGPDGALYAITDGEDCIELTDGKWILPLKISWPLNSYFRGVTTKAVTSY